MRERLERLREAWAALSAREQRLLGAMGAVALVLALGTGVMVVGSSMDQLREERDGLKEALASIDAAGPRIEAALQRKAAAQARYDNPVGPLGSYVEQKAQEQGLELRQVNEQPETKLGKYTRRHVRVNLNSVELRPLMRLVASLYDGNVPVALEQLDIQHYAGGDRYNVELGVYAFDDKSSRSASKGLE